jgi:hypothetical protein
MISVTEGKTVIVHLFRGRPRAHAANDIALQGLPIIFAENLDIDFLPEHAWQLRPFLPAKEIRDDAAAFGRAHADNVFAVEIRIVSENFRALIRFRGGHKRGSRHERGR